MEDESTPRQTQCSQCQERNMATASTSTAALVATGTERVENYAETTTLFRDFQRERNNDRCRHLGSRPINSGRSTKRRRPNEATKPNESVLVKIGVMHRVNNIWRRKSGTLTPTEVLLSDTYDAVLTKGKEALKLIFPGLKATELITFHGQSLKNLPGSETAFTIGGYHSQTNITYQKMRLFIRHFDTDPPIETEELSDHVSISDTSSESHSESSPETHRRSIRLQDLQELPDIGIDVSTASSHAGTTFHSLEANTIARRSWERNLYEGSTTAARAPTPTGSSEDFIGQSIFDEVEQTEQALLDSTMTFNSGQEIIEWHIHQILSSEKQLISAHRMDVWTTFKSVTKRPGFSYLKEPKIEFLEENAVDNGGPKREFMVLLLRAFIHEKGLFEGKDGMLYFTCNVEQLDKRMFRELGSAFAWSVIHGGPGLHCFMPEVVQLMLDNDPNVTHLLDYMMDQEFVSNLHKIMDCEEANWQDAINFTSNYFISFGSNVNSWKYNERKTTANMLIKHFIYRRNKLAYDHFIEGMNNVGRLWNLVQRYPEKLLFLFENSGGKVTYEKMKDLITFEFSDRDSNDGKAERRTANLFNNFMQDLEAAEIYGHNDLEVEDGIRTLEELEVAKEENNLTLKDFLEFLTGSNSIPALGFHRKITVNFFDLVLTCNTKEYPRVSTCGLTITIPRFAVDAEVFATYMKTAMRGGMNHFGFC